MAIAMRTSLRCWFGAMRLLTPNYRMGRRAVHVDPMAFSLKDRMLQRGGRIGREASNRQNDDFGQVANPAMGSIMRK
ncbi:MAG TPA: hypothetical protein VLB69_12045 [Rudaea sp.]|nr:hypothetical protein [Rudaea sp.]